LNREQWTKVDEYLDGVFGLGDPVLESAIAASEAAGLPDMAVSPGQGRLLHILARSVGAERALELGTLGGYSAIWIARALGQHGRLITIERDPNFAGIAKSNFAKVGVGNLIDLRIGDALDLLPRIAAEDAGPFDFIFIDADKVRIPDYFDWAVRLSRPGALIVVDNVIRAGRVIDDRTADPSVRGVRRLNDMIAADERVIATTIQTVGAKGYDGFLLAIVVAN
jgi:predicted O-methyltransferase YrrM